LQNGLSPDEEDAMPAQPRSMPRAAASDWRIVEGEARTLDTDDIGGLVLAALHGAHNLQDVVLRRLAELIGNAEVRPVLFHDLARKALTADPAIGRAMRRDAFAVVERDPAAGRLIEPILFYKGFHAIETHRIAHWLWREGRRDFALWLQSRSSEIFQVDIHPAVRIGQGLFLDHATGFTVGETALIEDDVSILHSVTLGGTGIAGGNRHPTIRRGVLIGAGAKILGDVEIGEAAMVAAGSVVLESVAPFTTVAGVPARQVSDSRRNADSAPSRTMDQLLDEDAYDSFAYVI
jgi:serine O-acetyltransferase